MFMLLLFLHREKSLPCFLAATVPDNPNFCGQVNVVYKFDKVASLCPSDNVYLLTDSDY